MIMNRTLLTLVLSAVLLSQPSLAIAEEKSEGVTLYAGWSIPEYVTPPPNLPTLRHYFLKDFELLSDSRSGHYRVNPLSNYTDFAMKVRNNKFLNQQMEDTALLSYLFYENGKVVYDEISPRHRFGDLYGNNTQHLSNSVGKSFVSYLVGHAICEGHIDSLEQKVNDWPIIKNTLYHNQNLIDLLNMNAGDSSYVDDFKGLIPTGRWYNVHSIKSFADRELNGTQPKKGFQRKHHYNGLLTNILLNYLDFKTGHQLHDFLKKVFQNRVKIEYPMTMRYNKFARKDNGEMTNLEISSKEGTAIYIFYLTRYDYLRIAVAMLEDWKQDNCVGQYLKEIFKNKIQKKRYLNKEKGYRFSPSHYAGQFHLNYYGLEGKNIFGMDGYGGQAILIDFDKSRIVAISSVHADYDYEKLVLAPMKDGKIIGAEEIKSAIHQDYDPDKGSLSTLTMRIPSKRRLDRSKESLTARFSCLQKYIENRGIDGFPSSKEVAGFIANLSTYTFIENDAVKSGTDTEKLSQFQLSRLGLPRSSVVQHKKLLLNLVNFEGNAKQYCNSISK